PSRFTPRVRPKTKMADRNTTLVRVIWLVCGVSAVAAIAMAWYEAGHPLAEAERRNLWLAYTLPYVVVGASAWAFRLRRQTRALAVLLGCTAVVAILGTFARYGELQFALSLMEA